MKKKICLVFAACLLFTACSADTSKEVNESATAPQAVETTPAVTTTQPEEEKPAEYIAFFEEEKVHNVYIDFSDEDWEAIKAAPKDEIYYSANVKIDDISLENVGVRTKGNSSLRLGTEQGLGRFPFHLKFDKYVDKQRFLDLDDLVLNNCNDDPSYIREYYGYQAFRELGFDPSLTAFFNVYVNGELKGFYLGVEVIDSSYLDRVYGGHKESLYKAREGATLETTMKIDLLDGKKGAPEDKADVKELIKILNETIRGEKGEIESVLDVDSVLRYFATCAVIHDWDDYSGWFSQNYYFYKNNGKFEIIPWDLNESFFQTQAFYNWSAGAREDIASPVTGWDSIKKRPMADKLLAVPEYYKKYLEYCDQLSKWLEKITTDGSLQRTYDLISEFAKADPTGFFGAGAFELQFDPTYSAGIAGFMSERVEYLKIRLPQLLSKDGGYVEPIIVTTEATTPPEEEDNGIDEQENNDANDENDVNEGAGGADIENGNVDENAAAD